MEKEQNGPNRSYQRHGRNESALEPTPQSNISRQEINFDGHD
jgi:hypothetical protein